MPPKLYTKLPSGRYKEVDKAVMPSADFMLDCIWMSYRYCIGSHTIATHMHAGDMAEFFREHQDFMSDERRKFTSLDIRREISDVVRCHSNIDVDGYCKNSDAYSILLEYCLKNGMKYTDIAKNTFTINTDTGECSHLPLDESGYIKYMDLKDLLVWSKLANYLDPHEQITYKYNGEENAEMGFRFYMVDGEGNINEYYVTCDGYSERPHIDTYINPEYIIKVEPIKK